MSAGPLIGAAHSGRRLRLSAESRRGARTEDRTFPTDLMVEVASPLDFYYDGQWIAGRTLTTVSLAS